MGQPRIMYSGVRLPQPDSMDYAMKLRRVRVQSIAFAVLGAWLWFALSVVASAQPTSASGSASRAPALNILTTLPEAYARSRARAFERANPGTRVELTVQRPDQVLAMLRSSTPAQRAHLIWSASPESFSAAAADGMLLGADGEPQPFGVSAPIDQGTTLRAQHLMRIAFARPAGPSAPAWPERWQDLAQGDCAARLSNPFAVSGGVASILLEAVLQDRGWDAGWELLAAIAANSTNPSSQTPQLSLVFEEVAAGEATLELRSALVVLARSRIALVAAGSRDIRVAQRFMRFITAEPAVNAAQPPTTATSRVAPASISQYLSIDLAQLERREPIMAALTRQWLVVNAPALKQTSVALAQAMRRAAANPSDTAFRRALDEARATAFGPALSERLLTEDTVLQAFNPQIREALRRPRVASLESQWAASALDRQSKALSRLGALAGPNAGSAASSPLPPARLTP